MHSNYLCSFHIPKTGGTTFAHHIRTSLAENEFFQHGPFARANRFMQNLPQLEELSSHEISQIRAVHGHGAGLDVATSLPNRFPEYLVILRDPYERFISGFNHLNSERRKNALPPIASHTYHNTRGGNLYAKLLYKYFGPLSEDDKGLSMEGLLPVLQSFKYLIVTENIDEQLPLLCSRLNLPTHEVESKRIRAKKPEVLLDQERFRKENELDYQIYEQLTSQHSALENPFGYAPGKLETYLQAAWDNSSTQKKLHSAYKDLVASLEKSLKLHAAHQKLNSQDNTHVQDLPELCRLVERSLDSWLSSLDSASLSMAYFWTGIMFMNSKNITQSEKYFRDSISLNPKNHNSLGRLAQIMARRNNYFEASELIDRAIDIRPDNQTNLKIRERVKNKKA